MRRAIVLVGITVIVAYVTTVFVDVGSPAVEWLDAIVPIVAAAAAALLCISAARRTSGRQRLVWALFGAGCASWALGDAAVTVVDRIGRSPDAFWLADAGYLGLVGLWLAALAVHPLIARRGVDLAASIVDALTIIAVGAALIAQFAVRPLIDARLPALDLVVLLAYLLADLILVGLFVYLFARSRLELASASFWFGGAIIFTLAADANYSLLSSADSYATGSPIDLLRLAAFVLLGAAAFLKRPVTTRLTREAGESHFVALLGSIATAGLVAWAAIDDEPLLLGVGASIAATLVVVRRALFALENRRLVHTVREAARHAEEVATAKEAFVTEASHQLRTPLTSMRVRLDVIKMTGLDDPMTEEYLEELSDEVDRLRRLAERLLTLASTDVVTPKQPRDVVRVVQESVARLSQRARLAQVDLRVYELPAEAVVLAGPGALDEAVMNLLDNALKYSPPGGTAAISVTSGEGFYEVCIEDDGPGFDEGSAQRLFEPFYRDSSQKPGFGLGLAIVKRICDSENADVALERRVEGGTRARVRWPMLRSDVFAATASD